MKYYIFILVILISSCRGEDFLPDVDALRDPNLIGTWREAEGSVNALDSTFIVFTNDGYFGGTYYVNNKQLNGFTDLDGLWHNIYLTDDDTKKGKYYTASLTKHWTNGRWEHEEYYYYSNDKDTLIMVSDNYEYKYVRNEYQLIFNKYKYIGIE